MKNFLLLIYYNTLALPFGIKLLALAALLATSLQYFTLSQQMAWGLSLLLVLSAGCIVSKFPNLIGKSK